MTDGLSDLQVQRTEALLAGSWGQSIVKYLGLTQAACKLSGDPNRGQAHQMLLVNPEAVSTGRKKEHHQLKKN